MTLFRHYYALGPVAIPGVGVTASAKHAAAVAVPRQAVAQAQTYESLVLGLSPDHYWPMDEASGNPADAAGSLDLTAYGSPTYQDTGPTINSVVQNAMTFDGTSDYCIGSEAVDDGVTTSTGLTVSFWLKSSQSGASAYAVNKAVTGDMTWALYWPGSGLGNMDVYTFTTDGATFMASAWGSSGVFLDGGWHFVCARVAASTNYAYMEVDDVVHCQDTTVAGTWNAESDSVLGVMASAAGFNRLSGSICHLAIWHSELSASDRTKLYNGY